MYLEAVFERFAQKSPVTVMSRALMENALAPEALNNIFTEHAEHQYERKLLFSSVVDLMGLVVCKIQPAISYHPQSGWFDEGPQRGPRGCEGG